MVKTGFLKGKSEEIDTEKRREKKRKEKRRDLFKITGDEPAWWWQLIGSPSLCLTQCTMPLLYTAVGSGCYYHSLSNLRAFAPADPGFLIVQISV